MPIRKIFTMSCLACGVSLFAASKPMAEVIFNPVKYQNVSVSRVVKDMERGYRSAGFKYGRRTRLYELDDGRVVDELVYTYKARGIASLTGRVSYHLTYGPVPTVCSPCEVLVQSLDTVGGKSSSQQEEKLLESMSVAHVKAITNVGGLLGRRPVQDRKLNCPVGISC